jgi:hypothetical protein
MKNPRWSEELTRGLEADKARIKYGCAKALRIVSQERPELLYPHFGGVRRIMIMLRSPTVRSRQRLWPGCRAGRAEGAGGEEDLDVR